MPEEQEDAIVASEDLHLGKIITNRICKFNHSIATTIKAVGAVVNRKAYTTRSRITEGKQ